MEQKSAFPYDQDVGPYSGFWFIRFMGTSGSDKMIPEVILNFSRVL